MARDLRIRVRTLGTEQVRNALRGIARETQRSSQQQQRATRGRLTEEQRVARELARTHAQMERNRVRETERSARAQTRAVEREARAQRRIQEREAAAAARTAERERRRAERTPPRRGGGGGGGIVGSVASGVVAAGGAALSTVERYGAAGGVRSREQIMAERADRRQRLIRLNRQMGGERGAWQAVDRQVQATAGRTGISQDDLTRGLETAQARFTNAPTVLANLDSLARVSQTTGASFDDVVGTMGSAQSAFRLNDDEARQFAGMMVDAGNRGSIDAAELSAAFAPALGSVQRGTQMGGIEGAAQTLGLFETIGRGQATPAEAATMSTRLVESLNDRRTQGRLRRAGVDVLDDEGQMRPLEEIVRDMSTSRLATNQGLFQDTFRNVEARQGAGIAMAEYARDPEAVGELFHVSAEEGQRYVNETAAELDADPSARFLRQGIEQEKAWVEGGQEVELMTTMTDLASRMTELTTQYPLATEALGVFTAGLQAAVPLMTMISALGGGGGLAGLLGGGGAVGAGGAAAGGGLLAAAPALLGGAAIVGGVGAGVVAYQRNKAETERRAAGERYLVRNPGAVSAELLANVTNDPSLISPEARRRGSMMSLGRSRDATRAEIMGGASSTPAGTIVADTAFTQAVAAAVATGARQGIEGRERDGGVQRGRSPASSAW